MLDLITALPETFTPALLVLSALFAFAESAFGLGVVVPGELAVLVLGAAASTPVQVLLALTVITLAASAADHVGYLLGRRRSEEHTSELQSRGHLVCRLLLEKKNKTTAKGERART